jgi:hypothetical protein
MARCLSLFEDSCVVTQTVRHGVPVDVAAEMSGARRVHRAVEQVGKEST